MYANCTILYYYNCVQVLLRQEHHDEGAWQTVRVQVRFPWADDRVPPKPTADAAAAAGAVVRGRRTAAVWFAVHVRVRRSIWPTTRVLVTRGRHIVGHAIPGRAVLLVDVRATRTVSAPGRRSTVPAVMLCCIIRSPIPCSSQRVHHRPSGPCRNDITDNDNNNNDDDDEKIPAHSYIRSDIPPCISITFFSF